MATFDLNVSGDRAERDEEEKVRDFANEILVVLSLEFECAVADIYENVAIKPDSEKSVEIT